VIPALTEGEKKELLQYLIKEKLKIGRGESDVAETVLLSMVSLLKNEKTIGRIVSLLNEALFNLKIQRNNNNDPVDNSNQQFSEVDLFNELQSQLS
jgi:hypothetical protein